ncbi:FAD binding domain-containing protein [Actinoplanes philippinensis]|uniref:FAD binding domain-containing protein n=1 Tax=Actinoplanes philippinensis TaxID=35752 RepID=A0A1I2N5G6_9ACTN|nr:FAD binding domain-containing protein [Actinoplanes philippinensis]
MRVMIIGAGIGGLTLAQALHHGGIEVSVHDRDPRVEATGGYRLHLDDRACEVLRRHLSPQHYHALLASSVSRATLQPLPECGPVLRPSGRGWRPALGGLLGPSSALTGTVLLVDVLLHDAQRCPADGAGEVRTRPEFVGPVVVAHEVGELLPQTA